MACADCEHRRVRPPGPWLQHLFWLRRLLKGGAPLDLDDLPMDTWMDLGLLSEELEALERARGGRCPLF